MNKLPFWNADLPEMIQKFGSPLFIFDENIIKENYSVLSSSFLRHYPAYRIFYSIKTNYLPEILRIMKRAGAGVEAVSGLEYALAKSLQFQPENIIFNGPVKKRGDLIAALKDGCILNVDNETELEEINGIAANTGTRARIGIRVNTTASPYPWQRFGWNIENGEAFASANKIKKELQHVDLVGIHAHIGTNISESQPYIQLANIISNLANNIESNLGFSIDYLDLGGGFAPSTEKQIAEFASALSKHTENRKRKVYLEPGRFIIDSAGFFATTVISIRKRQNMQIATIDGSITMFPSVHEQKERIIEVIPNKKGGAMSSAISTYIGGSSCMGIDFLAQGISLPPLSVGDILMFHNAGAYSVSRSEMFIHPRPPAVLIMENRTTMLLRKRDTFYDIFKLAPTSKN